VPKIIENEGEKPRKTRFENKESKKSSKILRQIKRVSSLKEPSFSTWEELCFLEEDSVDIVG
jgi:hypothetical protein